MSRVNLGCPNFCADWTCVDIYPKDPRVIQDEAVHWLRNQTPSDPTPLEYIKALNLIEHLPNVGEFFEAAYNALKLGGILCVRTDNAWFPLFHINIIHRWGWAAHCSDDYWPPIMNTTEHFSLYTKLHLRHYGRYAGFETVRISYTTVGARLLAIYRKPS
jgi:hypothetical protein